MCSASVILCPKVQEVDIGGFSDFQDVEALVKSPKSFLKSIHFDFYTKSQSLRDAMKVLPTTLVTELEDIDISGVLPPLDMFNSLVRMNISLHTVRIGIWQVGRIEDEVRIARIFDIAKCFFEAPVLEYLEIAEMNDTYEAIEEVAEICGADYCEDIRESSYLRKSFRKLRIINAVKFCIAANK